jgi:hypothetical protein
MCPLRRSLGFLAVMVLVAASFTGCARTPSTKKSAKVIQHHFQKYGKKYRSTVYGQSGVKEVEVTGQQEIHKGLVAVESFLTLGDGNVQRIHATLERGPFGWRFVSWENATGM